MELCEREETDERAVEYIPRPTLTFRCSIETSVANTGKLTLFYYERAMSLGFCLISYMTLSLKPRETVYIGSRKLNKMYL